MQQLAASTARKGTEQLLLLSDWPGVGDLLQLGRRAARVRHARQVSPKRQYQAQQLRRMLSFMGPALLIPLGDPLMTLVDTVCIGQFAGTTQLAALGPSQMMFSTVQFALQSLQVTTIRCAAAAAVFRDAFPVQCASSQLGAPGAW
jgi:hypothetical protein